MFINLHSSRAFLLMEVTVKTSVVRILDSSPFFSSSSLDFFHCPAKAFGMDPRVERQGFLCAKKRDKN